VAGGSALILAPMQFSERLSTRFTKLHRVVGRIYVFGALILAPAGVYVQYLDYSLGVLPSRSFMVEVFIQAALLMITTGIGFLFALKRMIPQHRQWMTRSYAAALTFFAIRAILGLWAGTKILSCSKSWCGRAPLLPFLSAILPTRFTSFNRCGHGGYECQSSRPCLRSRPQSRDAGRAGGASLARARFLISRSATIASAYAQAPSAREAVR
jgi:hypothetical protein